MKRKNKRYSAEGLLSEYSVELAVQEIDKILSSYSDDCRVIFKEDAAKIVNGYMVRSAYDRHRVCHIISRTRLTERSHEHLSAEWRFHNVAYALHIRRSSAVHPILDYVKDHRWYVNFVVRLMDMLNIE